MAESGSAWVRYTFTRAGRILRESVRKPEWKASYTVEASLIFSISLMVISSTILLGFSIYSESVKTVTSKMKEVDAAKVFRMVSEGKDLAGRLTEIGD